MNRSMARLFAIGAARVWARAWWILALATLAAFGPRAAGAQDTKAFPPGPGRTRVVLLGTGTPTADPRRSGPCVAVVSGGQAYLVDFGPGVVRRAVAAWESGVAELEPTRLTIAFVTHLHSDHTVGYPDLIFTPWTIGRREPLVVYGPSGIESMTEHILAAYEQDIEIRTRGLERSDATGYLVTAHEIEPGIVYRDGGLSVEAIAVHHGAWPEAYAYRFVAPDRTIVISGDTAPSDALLEAARGADVLVHEVYALEEFRRRPASWREYHETFHTSTHQLGEIASEARPKLLVLYHQLLFGASEETLLRELREVYDGEVAYGRDLEVY